MQRAMAQIGNAVRRDLGPHLWLALGLAVFPSWATAQDDSASVGPPPHFVAAWAPPGTLIDVSRTGVLRERVSIDVTSVPLRQALAEIRDRAKIELAYDLSALPAERTVSLHAKGITVASALGEVLLDTGLDVFMTRSGQLALLACPHLSRDHATGSVIAGRVTDRTTGAVLAGATVTAEDGRHIATTGPDGRYRIAGLGPGTQKLTVRYIGFAPATASVDVGRDTIVRDFVLVPSVQQLDQVVVTGTVVPTAIKAIPTPMSVIAADEIRRRSVLRLDQLFRGNVPGAFAWDQTTFDYVSMINVRGASSLDNKPVKVLVDGVELASPEFIATIDPNSVDRIELTRGPQASTVYGSGAAGGVLQIFTKKGRFGLVRPEGDIKTSIGITERTEGSQYALRQDHAVSVRGGGRKTRYNLAGYYRHDGELAPSYRNTNWSVTAAGENVEGPLTARFTARYARKTFDRSWFTALRDSGYTYFSKPPYETFDNLAQTYGVNLTYTPLRWWEHEVVAGYDQVSFDLFQTQPRFTTPADTSLHITSVDASRASVFYSTTATAKLTKSVEAKITSGFNHYLVTSTQAVTGNTRAVTGVLDGVTTFSRHPYTNTGWFAQTQLGFADALFVTSGLRAEWNPNFGGRFGAALSPRTGLAYVRPVGAGTAKFRFSYGESIRAPEPHQSDSLLGAPPNPFRQLANPMLGPERQRGWDAGVELYWGPTLFLGATYYRQNAVDLIQQVIVGVTDDSVFSQNRNVGRIRNAGAEFEGHLSLERLRVDGAFSIVDSRIRQLSPSVQGGYQVGDRVNGIPRASGSLMVSYAPFGSTTVSGILTHTSGWTDVNQIAFYGFALGSVPYRGSDRAYWIDYPGLTKFGASVEHYIRPGISAGLRVDNIGNSRRFESNNLVVPPLRTFSFIVRADY